MKAGSRPKPLIIAVAAVVVALIGYWAYTAHKNRALDATVVAAIQDASQRLRSALTLTVGPPGAITMQAAERIDTDAEDVDRRLRAVKRADAASNLELIDAADSYLLTVRELLKRIAGSHRNRLLLAGSTQALRDHMRADNRTGAWVSEAVRGKARMDQDFRAFRIDTEMVDKLLESFHVSQKKIAPYASPASLVDENLVDQARRRAAATLQRARAENESFRRR